MAHLIDLGFSPMEISDRMGHEGMSVTLRYVHLYPSKQKELVDKLNENHRTTRVREEDQSGENL